MTDLDDRFEAYVFASKRERIVQKMACYIVPLHGFIFWKWYYSEKPQNSIFSMVPKESDELFLIREEFHGEWNYPLSPRGQAL